MAINGKMEGHPLSISIIRLHLPKWKNAPWKNGGQLSFRHGKAFSTIGGS